MKKIYSLIIFLSFVSLWLTSMLPEKYETILGFVLIFTFGILHGSNDILLINKIKTKSNNTIKFSKYELVYLLTILISALFFYFVPSLALILFIFFSAYHFGEQHWERHNLFENKIILKIFYFIYGLLVLNLVFITNTIMVIDIVELISGIIISEKIIYTIFYFSLGSLFFLFILYLYKNKSSFNLVIGEVFFIIIFWIIYKSSSLIWGFSIYFIFWHSIPSLYEQISFIHSNFNKQTVIFYFKSAFLNWILSIIGFCIVYYFLKDQSNLNSIFFSFIAAITFPHTIVISSMFNSKK